MNNHLKNIQALCEELYASGNHPGLLDPDPMVFPRRYSTSEDLELVALLSALFAFGRVKSILNFLSTLFEDMEAAASKAGHASMTKWLSGANSLDIHRMLNGRVYRYVSTDWMTVILRAYGILHARHGSLEQAAIVAWSHLPESYGPVPTDDHRHIRNIEEFPPAAIAAAAALKLAFKEPVIVAGAELVYGNSSNAFDSGEIPGSLFPSVQVSRNRNGGIVVRGGAAKRIMLLLRWMVRSDDIDLGRWTFIRPADLVVPLDTHVMRISGQLGLRRRDAADMKTALEITESFRAICPEDPIRYDFVLTRFGIHPLLQNMNLGGTLNIQTEIGELLRSMSKMTTPDD